MLMKSDQNIAVQLKEIVNDHYFNVLVSLRYRFNRLMQVATESDLREAFMDQPEVLNSIIMSDKDMYSVSNDFIKEIQTNILRS